MTLDCNIMSKQIKDYIKKEIKKNNYKITLVIIEIGNNENNKRFIKLKQKACNEEGINLIHINYLEDTKEEIIIKKINKYNNSLLVDGIIIQLPLPVKFNENKLINCINYKKDIDSLTNYNKELLKNNKEIFIPCSVGGIIKIFNFYKIETNNKIIKIIGDSELLSKPLYNKFKSEKLNVELINIKDNNYKDKLLNSDIIITEINKKYFIKESDVKKDCIIIDGGMSYIENKVYGDVDPKVYDKVKYYTPVPNGVGVLIIPMMLYNLLTAHKRRMEK